MGVEVQTWNFKHKIRTVIGINYESFQLKAKQWLNINCLWIVVHFSKT